MKIHPTPVDLLNRAFLRLSDEYAAVLKELRVAAPANSRLRPILAGVEILHAQHAYFMPIEERFEPTEFPVLLEALELEAEWLTTKASILCLNHPEIASRLLRLSDSSLSVAPFAFKAWLWSQVQLPTETAPASASSDIEPQTVAA